ncbi:MAG: hypothetical protein WAK95_13395 [Desulfobacterales bacterium]
MINEIAKKGDPAQAAFSPGGVATAIGSLPFTDPEEALALITSELPEAPHWPQLPRRSRREHFLYQFLQPLLDCTMVVSRENRWMFDMTRETAAACLTDFYATCLPAEDGSSECLRTFLPSAEAAAGFHAFLAHLRSGGFKQARYLKGQIAGPLTVALELKDEQGRPAYYQGDLRDIIVRTLALNARCQAAALSGPGHTPIIFVDDPAVSACGSRFHLALDRKTILEDLNFIFTAIRSEGAITGVHSCEALDWSLLMETDTQIISLDAYRFGSSIVPYAAQLRAFLERGGVVAWGIVPTLDDPSTESCESLVRRLTGLWETLFPQAPARDVVLRQSMMTPACGTGLLDEDRARRIYRLTAEVSTVLRQSAGF